MILAGGIEVVDCSGVLGPETPLLKLPPDFAQDTPQVEIHKISEYDRTGRSGPGTGSSSASIRARTSTRRITGSPARTSGRLHRHAAVQRLVAPVNVLDFSRECAADPDFLLTIDHVKAWEAEHGRSARANGSCCGPTGTGARMTRRCS
jgi:kynurenine formamidase